MDKNILGKLASVINALNSVEVKGRANLINLSGSIAIIEEVMLALNDESKDAEHEE